MEHINFLNADICNISQDELLKKLSSGVVFTPNVDHLNKLQTDREFYEAYCSADWIICDSKIVYLCSKLFKKSICEPIPGSSFFSNFYTYHSNNHECRIFLLGASDGVAKVAMEKINNKVGRQIVVAAHSPSFGFENNVEECEEILKIVRSSNANVLILGVGAPKQEKWIIKNKDKLNNVKIFMALGATIDFEAGLLKRAPKVWQYLSLEWFYRWMQEPQRLFSRYFIEAPRFFLYYLKQLLGMYKNPF